ncbi:MAG: PSD1 domain-containing protein [Planctomycetes bacterium]|nr:PSD1 domain-containing protein [Planctomycetota bacterium]
MRRLSCSRAGFALARAVVAIVLVAIAGCSREPTPEPAASAPPKAEPVAAAPLEPVRYDRDVRPILSDRCFKCHGPDSAKRQKDLRLDVAEIATAVRGDHAAIVPGHPEASAMWRRVNSDDPSVRMPPPDSNKRPLSADEREIVRRWIAEGATYEPHWSFVPPKRPPVPEPKQASWCRNEIDRFVLAKLEREGVEPSPEADRETLLRRVFFDLTGLPPTPEELDAFVADERPDAYERWVERLLHEEPYRTRYAERMATPWCDAARFADTSGIHTDAGRTIWPWRDWLLAAYHDNMPFDRFVTEQLAGDLLPNATQAQKVASGFNRCHVTSDEGGALSEEYLVEYAVERAATTGAVFLGLTMGCARCHEHKFDPISQEDFYRFYAFFDSIDEPGVYSQLPDPKRAFEPFMTVATPEQSTELQVARDNLAELQRALDAPAPEEDAPRAAFFAEQSKKSGLEWKTATAVAAESTGGATLNVLPDGSILASGKNPDRDEHVITLRTDATGLRLLALEALADPSLPNGRVGRADNGNAVLTGVIAEAASVADPTKRQSLRFGWAWASREQPDGDFAVVNVLDPTDHLGWAVDAHRFAGGRVALLLADGPFGFDGGTDIVVRLQYDSVYARHTFGRVRLDVGRVGDAGIAALPAATSGWYLVGPFPADNDEAVFATAFGPEKETTLDLKHDFGGGNQFWRHGDGLRDGVLNGGLPTGVNATYVGKRLFVPAPRRIDLSLGSDDGFRLYLDGHEVASKKDARSLAADQDRATLELHPGIHTLVLKIVNVGGECGFYYRAEREASELTGDMVAAFLPDVARTQELNDRLVRAWRTAYSPLYREHVAKIAALESRVAELDREIPRTMVMQELEKPRETFVLVRGQYDHPDKTRPVTRAVPPALGKLPDDAPANRLGLARWMTSAGNPLVARVAVNRLWEMVFGTGIVRTSEDLGQQGEWPSHPELLDWLAVEFREGGWNVQSMLERLVTSATYRQSSRARPELRDRDPENRWFSFFPRRRLAAEQIRDQALYVSGLLVERLGGPSVKPYQPDGLWQEVAMPASNTRVFVRGDGDELWRRSLYTYWKRACPPPSLQTFDAPTREFCTIRRPTTDTPLQALVLWNDEQFVEAARVLAQHTLAVAGTDHDRIARLFRRCTGHSPDADAIESLHEELARFRKRYRESPDDASKLLDVGDSPVPTALDAAELAAWTLIANTVLNLDATISRG